MDDELIVATIFAWMGFFIPLLILVTIYKFVGGTMWLYLVFNPVLTLIYCFLLFALIGGTTDEIYREWKRRRRMNKITPHPLRRDKKMKECFCGKEAKHQCDTCGEWFCEEHIDYQFSPDEDETHSDTEKYWICEECVDLLHMEM